MTHCVADKVIYLLIIFILGHIHWLDLYSGVTPGRVQAPYYVVQGIEPSLAACQISTIMQYITPVLIQESQFGSVSISHISLGVSPSLFLASHNKK